MSDTPRTRKSYDDYVPFDDWSLVFELIKHHRALDIPRIVAQIERLKDSQRDLAAANEKIVELTAQLADQHRIAVGREMVLKAKNEQLSVLLLRSLGVLAAERRAALVAKP